MFWYNNTKIQRHWSIGTSKTRNVRHFNSTHLTTPKLTSESGHFQSICVPKIPVHIRVLHSC